MKIHDIEDADKLVTKDQLDIVIGKLENKIDARFNAVETRFNGIDSKFSNQRVLLIVAIVGVIAQIINAWIIVLSHH